VLFNSYAFLFFFLPATLVGFFQIGRYSRPLAALWLFAASLFFYGWWNPAYVGLLLASILFNYSIGTALVQGVHAGVDGGLFQRQQAVDVGLQR